MATAIEQPQHELRLLQYNVMEAIQGGYLDLLELVKKRIPSFDFNFTYYLPKQSKGKKNKNKSFTPLLYACKCNQTSIVKWLLEIPKLSKNCKTELNETALILASHNEKEDTMELIMELLNNGDQNLGSRDQHKLTALHVACYKGNVELAERLLRHNNAWFSKGLRPPKTIDRKQLRDIHGSTPFMMAVQNKHMGLVEMWLELEKEPTMMLRPVCEDRNKKGHNAVMMAIQSGQIDCLRKMADCNAISNEIGRAKTKCGWNVFHCAAASGRLDILKWLLSWNESALKTKELLDGKTEKEYTPFLLACEYHHFKIVEHLIELNEGVKDLITIDETTKNGMTGLHLAAKHDAEDIAELLLETGEINVFHEDNDGNTVLHIATNKSSTKVEEKLKQYLDADEYENLQDCKNKKNYTAEDVRVSIYIPLEIKKRGPASIEAFKNALSKGKTHINQCNLIVLGEARVGKTSLIRSILNMEFQPECESTQGIELDDIEFAENVDLTISESQQDTEIGKKVEPMERVEEQITDIIADEVKKVAPGPLDDKEQETSKFYFKPSSQETLRRSITRNIGKFKAATKDKHEYHDRQQRQYKQTERHEPPLHDDDDSPTPKATSTPTKPIPAAPLTAPSKDPVSKKQNAEPKKPPITKHESTKTSSESQDEAPDVTLDVTSSGQDSSRVVNYSRRNSNLSYSDSKKIRKKLKGKKQQPDQDLIFHTIDFAGQHLYRPMHHCFITNRAIYLVVFKLTELLHHIRSDPNLTTRNPISSEIRYWLNNIVAHAAGNGTTDCPKIFLVGTFKNGDPKADAAPLTTEDLKMVNHHLIEVFGLNDDVKQNRYNSIQPVSKGDKPIEFVFCLENSISANDRRNSGITPLIKKIRVLREEIPFLAKDFPSSYLQFEKKVLEMKAKRKKTPMITTRKEVEDWARGAGIEDEAGINTAIQFYHDIRVIVDQTLISNPFKGHQPGTPRIDSSISSTVLLSPQCLASVMTAVVKLPDSDASDVSLKKMKIVNHYGIIERKTLEAHLLSDLKAQNDSQPLVAISNVLQILESYCLIYKLSDLHHKLLGLPSDLKNDDHYLIPMKLPPFDTRRDKLVLHSRGYKFQFDFQSYLPTEVYIHTICFFLSMLESVEQHSGADLPDCVVLTDSCSKFLFIQLDDLPRAHWKIKMDQNLHNLEFEIIPLEAVKCPPSLFIQAVAERILAKVCINGSLGYFKYKGGVMDTCSKTKQEVLVPFVSFDSGKSGPRLIENLYCACNEESKDVNQILSKMLVDTDPIGGSDDNMTVLATSVGVLEIYEKYEEKLITLLQASLQLANVLCSAGLADRNAKNDAMISGISDYEKSTRVLNCFYCVLKAHENKKAILKKFCDEIECNFETEATKPLINEMRRKLENCRETVQ